MRKCSCDPKYHFPCGCKCYPKARAGFGWFYRFSGCTAGHNRVEVKDFDELKKEFIKKVKEK